MKVLLINPGFQRKIGNTKRVSPTLFPIGLAYLAAVLRQNNFEVKILDTNALNSTDQEILNFIERFDPQVVGIGAVTTTITRSFEIARMIKEKYPQIKIVLGGPHPTSLPDESISKNFVDFVVVGEGEFIFLDLVKEISKKGKKDFKKIDGLVYKNHGIITNKPRGRILNLDEIPFPAIDLLPLKKYASKDSKNKKFMSILTSRGCPYNCVYCNKLIFKRKFIMRSAENIIREITYLKEKYGYKDFHILDDLFTCDRGRVVEFCNLLIENKLNIKWKCANGVRVNTVDVELLKLMKKSGCYMLNYGVESGNQKILDLMRKNQTLEQIGNAVKITKNAGISCGCCFMFGNLGEDKNTMSQTLEFAKKLNPDIAMFSILIPYPGTDVERIIRKEGKIFIKNWDDYDNFTGQAVFEHGKLKKQHMEEIHKRSYKEFYLRPRYIFSQIFKQRTLNELKNRFDAFLALIEI